MAVNDAIETLARDRSLHGVTDPKMNSNGLDAPAPAVTNEDSTSNSEKENTNILLDKLSMVDNLTAILTEHADTNKTDILNKRNQAVSLSEDYNTHATDNVETDIIVSNKQTMDMTTDNVEVSDDVSSHKDTLEISDTLIGVTVPNNGIKCMEVQNQETSTNMFEEPVDVDTINDSAEMNMPLHGVTETGNGVKIPLHGVTELNSLDHCYSRQNNDSIIINPDYYATTEDEDDAVEGFLQLSAIDDPTVEFPGDNGQLLPIGTCIPDAALTNISIDTAAVTAAIENIALEETVSKTTSTVSTQTTFTRPRQRLTDLSSDSDLDNAHTKKPIT